MNLNGFSQTYLMYLDANNLYVCAMFQKLSINKIKGKKKHLNAMKSSQNAIMKKVIKHIYLN